MRILRTIIGADGKDRRLISDVEQKYIVYVGYVKDFQTNIKMRN